jgi:AcrR family transcriptional regulator
MGRTAKFSSDQFVDAALELVAEHGPGAVTVSGLAESLNAPIGSVYHRFASRDALLARLWLRTVHSFQEGFLDALRRRDGLAAALYTPRWVRTHLKEGRLLLLYRSDERISGPWPSDVESLARHLADELDMGIKEFTKQLFGRVKRSAVLRVKFALVDVPYAAVRESLRAGESPPVAMDELVSEAYKALLGRFP